MSYIPPSGPDAGDDHAVARAFGALLMAVGVLIMVLCGLCSLTALAIMIPMSGGHVGEITSFSGMVLMIGGIPAAVGFGLFAWGRSLRKKG